MIPFECPKCGADISDSYLSEDPDTGITAGWYCEDCDLSILDDGDWHDTD